MNEDLINLLSGRLGWTPTKITEALDNAIRLMNEELPENTQISIPAKSENITSVVSYEKKASKDYVSNLVEPLEWSQSKISEVLHAAMDMMNGKISEDMEMFVPVKNEETGLPLRFEKKTNKDFQTEVSHLMESTKNKISDALDSAVALMKDKFSEELEIFVPTTYRVIQQILTDDEKAGQEMVVRLLKNSKSVQSPVQSDIDGVVEVKEVRENEPIEVEDELRQTEPELNDIEIVLPKTRNTKFAGEDIVAELSRPLNWEQSKTSGILDTLVDIINEKLSENAQIFIPNFGVFETRKKMEYISVDHDTQQRYLIPPKIVATFKTA